MDPVGVLLLSEPHDLLATGDLNPGEDKVSITELLLVSLSRDFFLGMHADELVPTTVASLTSSAWGILLEIAFIISEARAGPTPSSIMASSSVSMGRGYFLKLFIAFMIAIR
jgi:hypothetical protein